MHGYFRKMCAFSSVCENIASMDTLELVLYVESFHDANVKEVK